jgi:superfamily I DNA/RNA helicase
VDETQDFSMPALRLVCALSGNRYEASLPDSLTLVGDAHQRIYGRRAILNKCGINVRGRSAKLYLNYRSTEHIRRLAVALLDGVSVDDLDGESDNNKGYHSLVVGTKPEMMRFDGFEEEMDAVAKKLKDWATEDKRPLCDYAVLCRTKDEVSAVGKALKRRSLDCLEIKTDDDDGVMKDSVRIATMHRAKGLEFVGVVLPRLNKGVWPLKPAGFDSLDQVSQRAHLTGELSLLYVAITRAMKHVYLSGVGDVPEELVALMKT